MHETTVLAKEFSEFRIVLTEHQFDSRVGKKLTRMSWSYYNYDYGMIIMLSKFLKIGNLNEIFVILSAIRWLIPLYGIFDCSQRKFRPHNSQQIWTKITPQRDGVFLCDYQVASPPLTVTMVFRTQIIHEKIKIAVPSSLYQKAGAE